MTRTERNRLAFLTATHVADDPYQGAFPAAGCALTVLLRDPRRTDESAGAARSTR